MPKFDAKSLGDVEFDFSGWKGIKGSPYEGRPIDEKGVIPEPSPRLVGDTMSRITEAFKKMDVADTIKSKGETDGMSAEEIQEALSKISDVEQFNEMSDELFDAAAHLCDGEPSRDALVSLGWRRFMAFLGYLMGELMSPEASSGAETGSDSRRLRSV